MADQVYELIKEEDNASEILKLSLNNSRFKKMKLEEKNNVIEEFDSKNLRSVLSNNKTEESCLNSLSS
jgi:hypothetical protein